MVVVVMLMVLMVVMMMTLVEWGGIGWYRKPVTVIRSFTAHNCRRVMGA